MIGFISTAFAEEAGHAAEHPPFWENPETWVAIAFVIFVAATARPIAKALGGGLDSHAAKLSQQLDEARQLREEAQNLVAESKRRQRDAVKEAEDIITAANDEAKRLAEKAAIDLERSVERRRELAVSRIAQAEADVVKEVRERAVEVAIEAASKVLADKLTGDAGERYNDDAIEEIGRHVN